MVERTKKDIFFKKITQRYKGELKLIVVIRALGLETELKQIEQEFKKCDYVIMLGKDGRTQTITFK